MKYPGVSELLHAMSELEKSGHHAAVVAWLRVIVEQRKKELREAKD